MTILENFKDDPYTFIKEESISNIVKLIEAANEIYRNSSELLMTDAEYDLLLDELKRRNSKHKLLSKIGAVVHTKDKVKLPCYMGSMDKIKPGTGNLDKWIKKYKGNYILSDKLDGTSALLVLRSDGKNMLFTRGNGIHGTNISSMLKGINGIPNIKENLVVRGELLVSKKNYEKNKKKYCNSRAMINGLVNKKSIKMLELKLIDFVAYELVRPWYNISKQYKVLSKLKFNTVVNKKVTTCLSAWKAEGQAQSLDNITEKSLSEYLKERKKNSDFDIDGIIVVDDNNHIRNKSKNPKYGFAYKDILEDQIAETEVLFVEWNISKDGYIKPRVHLKPVQVAGITIKHVTGNNAKYIKENGIGKGTKIKIIRSGDVIPKIHEVLVKKKPDFPDFDYIWNDTNVDIIIDETISNEDHEYDMLVKNLTYFFKKMKIKYVDEAIIRKIIDINLDSIKKIILAKEKDFLEVEGFKEKMAKKIHTNIQNAIKEVKLSTLMTATNIFGHGLGERKLDIIIKEYPDIFKKKYNDKKLLEMIVKLDGYEVKSANKFIEGYSNFRIFLKNNPKIKITKKSSKKGKFSDKRIVFTGFRDKTLEEFVTSEGGTMATSVSSNTYIVVTNDKRSSSSKLKAANKHDIPILLKQEFVSKFKIKLVDI
jgi:NAD-dependent DNA ligase